MRTAANPLLSTYTPATVASCKLCEDHFDPKNFKEELRRQNQEELRRQNQSHDATDYQQFVPDDGLVAEEVSSEIGLSFQSEGNGGQCDTGESADQPSYNLDPFHHENENIEAFDGADSTRDNNDCTLLLRVNRAERVRTYSPKSKSASTPLVEVNSAERVHTNTRKSNLVSALSQRNIEDIGPQAFMECIKLQHENILVLRAENERLQKAHDKLEVDLADKTRNLKLEQQRHARTEESLEHLKSNCIESTDDLIEDRDMMIPASKTIDRFQFRDLQTSYTVEDQNISKRI
ncbi:hypothetical protein QAD02_019407 [Eretmocerus hayati]|uniref:Uncharacterized protein n=1 Tax=Eretmocerus hayati TaxID=131215 RepID=A0ACC2PJK8_9HYME|nr:hypothetical protein QAD02_019407 [Eretmocerus hayati]